jgi:putative membrane protein (TIGR04086 family)
MRATAKKRPTAALGTTSTQPNTLARLAGATLRGGAWGLILALVLSLVGALIAYLNADPDALLVPLALGSLSLSCLVAGFFAQRSYKSAPIVCGGVCAIALLIVCWLIGALLPDSTNATLSTTARWGMRGGAVAFCMLGALMAANLPRGKRGKRKKRK